MASRVAMGLLATKVILKCFKSVKYHHVCLFFFTKILIALKNMAGSFSLDLQTALPKLSQI